MTLEYPECDRVDCWYKRNYDRINGYHKSYKYIFSRYIDDRRYDLRSYYVPQTVELCDIDSDHMKFIGYCACCDQRMGDEWITLTDNIKFCGKCIGKDILLERLGAETYSQFDFDDDLFSNFPNLPRT